VASLLTALVMPSSPAPRAPEPPPAVAKAPSADPPRPAEPPAPPAAAPEPPTEEPKNETSHKPSAPELVAGHEPAQAAVRRARPPPPRPVALRDDPEAALPETPEPSTPSSENDGTTPGSTSDAPAKPRGTWQTSPGF
jgi:hypothetical protein